MSPASELRSTVPVDPFDAIRVAYGFVPNLFHAQSGLPCAVESEAQIIVAVLLNQGTLSLTSTKLQLEHEPAEIVQRAKEANAEAFYQLARPCERGIFQAALAILGNVTDAEDVAQEAVLKAFEHISSFRGESKFSTWLIQITINEARMKLRKDRPDLYHSLDESNGTEDGEFLPRELADWREIPSTALENRELRETLTRALVGLSPKYRSVFVLRDVQGRSIAETARLLGISEVCVKTRLCRARLQMRDALAPGFRPGWDCSSLPVGTMKAEHSTEHAEPGWR